VVLHETTFEGNSSFELTVHKLENKTAEDLKDIHEKYYNLIFTPAISKNQILDNFNKMHFITNEYFTFGTS
jgi:hypothetical protein